MNQGTRKAGTGGIMKTGIVFAVVFFGALFSGTAFAGWQDQCKEEIGKLCPGRGGSQFELYSCLNESPSSLGGTCRDALSQAVKALQTAETRCQEDVNKYCETVPPGRGGWLRCLKAKGEGVSPFCRQALGEVAAAGL
jgi:hypothetical protein